MKTQGFKHQLTALAAALGRDYFAYLMEQGTGKSWTFLADSERSYAMGEINAVFILAPKGVHNNWVKREIPTHMEGDIVARAWTSSDAKYAVRHLEELFKPRPEGEPVPLRILSMNFEALNTKKGFAFAMRFIQTFDVMFGVDESSRIKNPKAARTKAVMKLRPFARKVRILSGTPVTNKPMDIFAQYEFMREGLLGTTSYRAFTAEYAELMDSDSKMMKNMIQKNPRMAFAQIIKKDANGRPIWRNMERLQKKIAPHCFRVLKKDCLDLPEKIYKTYPFELDAKQRAAYMILDKQLRLILTDGEVMTVERLAKITKAQQITSGFFVIPGTDGEVQLVASDKNPRMIALMELLEDTDGKMIIWARFRQEIEMICHELRKAGREVVEYHGGVNKDDREHAIDSFQSGSAEIFVGQAQAGGIGLTLTAAETVIYYSNSYDLELRLQSEDRAHRIGTTKHVVYYDLVAEDTIDEQIALALQSKKSFAEDLLDFKPADVKKLEEKMNKELDEQIRKDVTEAKLEKAQLIDAQMAAMFERDSVPTK